MKYRVFVKIGMEDITILGTSAQR